MPGLIELDTTVEAVIECAGFSGNTDVGDTSMFEVSIQDKFAAAHNLRGYQGNCENLHGHNWLVEAAVRGKRDVNGMVVDFRVLKGILKDTLETLDHNYLNELDYFKERNTTTENIAEFIHERMSSALPDGVEICRVSVWESPGSGVTYIPDSSSLKYDCGKDIER